MNVFKNKIINKPSVLSDPVGEYTKKTLTSILDKDDSLLDAVDFRIILNPNLPSGSYNETRYFLTISYDHLIAPFDDQLEMLPSWIDFIMQNDDDISNDFNVSSFDILTNLFNDLTVDYTEVIMNKEECSLMGWGIQEYRYVSKSQLVCEILEAINNYWIGRDWINQLVNSLLSGAEIQKKWLYELYEESNIVSNLLSEDIILEMLET